MAKWAERDYEGRLVVSVLDFICESGDNPVNLAVPSKLTETELSLQTLTTMEDAERYRHSLAVFAPNTD